MTLYEKRGKRYVPVADNTQWDNWPHGFHIVYTPSHGGHSIRFNINPDKASYYAAIREKDEALCDEIRECFKMRPAKMELSQAQVKAWRAFEKAMGNDIYAIASESVNGVVDRIMAVLVKP